MTVNKANDYTAGVYTVTAADHNNATLNINTGMQGATVFFVSILRAGVEVKQDAVVTMSAGVLTVANGGTTYSLTASDKIYWLVF